VLTTAIPEIGVVATGDRRGIMAGAERAATKVSKEFSKTIICVIYVLSRRTRAPLAGPAAGKWSAGMRLRCFAHNPERELGAKRIFLFGFAVTL
jgi:hypothetical protein